MVRSFPHCSLPIVQHFVGIAETVVDTAADTAADIDAGVDTEAGTVVAGVGTAVVDTAVAGVGRD